MTQDNVRQAATTSSQGGEGSRSCLVSLSQQDSVLKVRAELNIGSGSFKLRKSLGKHTGMFFLVKYSQEPESKNSSLLCFTFVESEKFK